MIPEADWEAAFAPAKPKVHHAPMPSLPELAKQPSIPSRQPPPPPTAARSAASAVPANGAPPPASSEPAPANPTSGAKLENLAFPQVRTRACVLLMIGSISLLFTNIMQSVTNANDANGSAETKYGPRLLWKRSLRRTHKKDGIHAGKGQSQACLSDRHGLIRADQMLSDSCKSFFMQVFAPGSANSVQKLSEVFKAEWPGGVKTAQQSVDEEVLDPAAWVPMSEHDRGRCEQAFTTKVRVIAKLWVIGGLWRLSWPKWVCHDWQTGCGRPDAGWVYCVARVWVSWKAGEMQKAEL